MESLQTEIAHCNEMNHRLFDIEIDMNAWDIARNITEWISFHPFHGQGNSMILFRVIAIHRSVNDICRRTVIISGILVLLTNHLSNP
jgi:hypothetical protein